MSQFWAARRCTFTPPFTSGYSWSNVDIYVYEGLTDPTTISDATILTYSSSTAIAEDGDTVFFRGTNGYYGAWRIDEIYPNPLGEQFPYTYLNGQWYFQDDGTGNFTPVPGAFLLGMIGLSVAGIKLRKHA